MNQVQETLEQVIDAKARILLANVQTQISKYRECELKNKIILKIAEIFIMLDDRNNGSV